MATGRAATPAANVRLARPGVARSVEQRRLPRPVDEGRSLRLDEHEPTVRQPVDRADLLSTTGRPRARRGRRRDGPEAAVVPRHARDDGAAVPVDREAQAGDQERDGEDEADVEQVDEAVERVAGGAVDVAVPAEPGPSHAGLAAVARSRAARSSVYVRVRASVSANAVVPTSSPITVAAKATRRSSASAPISPSLSAASPGASGIRVPMRPTAGPARTSNRVRSRRRW